MGPAMNLLLALILTAVVLHQGAETPAFLDQPPIVGVAAPARARERRAERVLAVAVRHVVPHGVGAVFRG